MRRNFFRRRSSALVSTAAAVGGACSLVGGPAVALELGNVQVESTLGQPLRASIPFSLNPNEQMFDFCVRLRQGLDGGPIPAVSRANISIAGNRIVLTGDVAVKDPLLNLQVVVDCPYTPQLSRQYTLIVDPVEYVENRTLFVEEPAPAASTTVAAQTAPAIATPADPAPAAVVVNDVQPIAMNSEYRVQTGDSASAIASRIEGRANSLQSAISILVASNPEAFPDGDAAMLLAGSLLVIPPMIEEFASGESIAEPIVADVREYAPGPAAVEPGATLTPPTPNAEPVVLPDEAAEDVQEPTTVAEDPAAAIEDQPPAIADEAVAAPVDATADAGSDVGASEEAVATAISEPSAEIAPEPVADELQPGDIVVAPATESTATAGAAADTPNVASPVVSTEGATTTGSGDSWAWLSWPVGGALLLVGGILLLGRQLRDKFGSVAVGDPQKPAPSPESQVDVSADESAAAESAESAGQEIAPEPEIAGVDFELDDSINNEAISLDADLDAGTGLQDSSDLDVAQDFGFAASGQVEQEIDHEIPAEAAVEPDKPETDIIPPTHKISEPSILESEVAPEDDYDMSMIVDATKQQIGDTQLTAQDLQAVPVDLDIDATGSYSISDDTLASEADLEALEQDYQEEFTQTQALNQEIEQAAQELAAKLDDDIADDDPTGDEPILTIGDPDLDPTAEMTARQPEDELTAEMPARTIETEVTAEMPSQTSATEVTAELAANVDAQNDDIADEEVTSKLAAAGNEPTVEMQVETEIANLDDDK